MKKQRRFILFILMLSIIPLAYNQDVEEDVGVDEKILDLIFEYGQIGYNNIMSGGNFDTADIFLNKALEIAYATPGYTINSRVAINHINLASVYRKLFNYNLALYHLTAAEEILKRVEPESSYFGTIYNNKGNIIRSNSDIFRTREYYEYALNWLIRIGEKNTNDFLEIYKNYIDILFEMSENDLAIQKLSSIDIDHLSLSPDLEFDFRMMKANGFVMDSLYEDAMINYLKAGEIVSEGNLRQKALKTYDYHFSLIWYYISIEDLEAAENEISEGLLFLKSLDDNSARTEITYYSTYQYLAAYILHLKGEYKNALQIINLITNKITNFFDDQSATSINSKIRNENASLLPDLYSLKSRILFQLYLKEESAVTLRDAYESYKITIEILNSTKISMQNEDSKIFATSAIVELYTEAIYVGNLLYDLTSDIKFLEKSFEFSESSRSFALFSEIKSNEAIEFSDLPPEDKQKETELMGMIQGYEGELYSELMSADPDSSQVALFKDKLFHLKNERDDLMHEIELNNTKYYELKYQPHFVSLEELQEKLPHRDALIEYVLTDTMLITYVIDKNNVNVLTQEIGPEFSNECIEYYYLLDKQNFSSGVKENYRRFVELGQKFYSILVEPCLQYTDRKNLTIVPDGAITYIPFEGLLTDEADTEYIDYLHLPYLIRDYSIGYSQSATLMFSERLKSKPTEDKVLAFAPLYRKSGYDMDSSYLRQVEEENGILLPLGGIIKEVQSIKEMVPAMVFMNENATEKNFKKHAPDYNVLHLAMHTIMRDDNPLYSYLAFTTEESNDPSDTLEDNKMYAYEIYNLPLNANMAVLSSCNSGIGKMHKGEGMMSLARGFYYAGCPSIVMTLWQVTDKSSSELMTNFYKYLKKGKSKQEAMRLAKIDYLETADDLTSNPYFWSGFVVLGDSSPIYKKSGVAYWISILVLFIGLLIFFQYKKKK